METKTPEVNPLDSMLPILLRGEVVYMEATLAAMRAIKKEAGIDFMNPTRTEAEAEAVYLQMQDIDTLLAVLSCMIRFVGDSAVRKAQAKWTPDELAFALNASNLYSFISSVYQTLNAGQDVGDVPTTEGAAEPTADPQEPESAI